MTNILIIGAGAIGSAFSFPCIEKNHKVTITGTHLEDNFLQKLKENNNFHPVLETHLDEKINIIKYGNLFNDLNHVPDLITVAVNSKGIDWAIEQIQRLSDNNNLPPILVLTKGLNIYKNDYEVLSKKIERVLISKGINLPNITAVGGPCLAKELANKINTRVIYSCKNLETLNWLKKKLSSDYYNISITNDVIGAEICSAIKNIYSIIIGASKEIGKNNIHNNLYNKNYFNLVAAIFTQSLHEMSEIVKFLNGKKTTVYGLAGFGDLHVSASGGRNSKFGSFIGKGFTYSEIKEIKMPNETTEGVELIFEIGSKLKNDFNINSLPLLFSLIETIIENKKFKLNFNNFI